jgi:Flp pilus assembly pilin Flp
MRLPEMLMYGCWLWVYCPKQFSARSLPQMSTFLRGLVFNDDGQDIAEYAVMVAVILIIVVGTIRLVGSNANTVFSNVASTVQ